MYPLPRILLILLFLLMVSGCGGGIFEKAENEFRATEYGGSGAYIPFVAGKVGGVRVIQNGEVDACIRYQGDKVTVTSHGCKGMYYPFPE